MTIHLCPPIPLQSNLRYLSQPHRHQFAERTFGRISAVSTIANGLLREDVHKSAGGEDSGQFDIDRLFRWWADECYYFTAKAESLIHCGRVLLDLAKGLHVVDE